MVGPGFRKWEANPPVLTHSEAWLMGPEEEATTRYAISQGVEGVKECSGSTSRHSMGVLIWQSGEICGYYSLNQN